MRVERNQSEAKSIKLDNDVSQMKSKCYESEVQVNVLRQQLTETKQKLNKSLEEVTIIAVVVRCIGTLIRFFFAYAVLQINNLHASRRDMTIRLSAKHDELSDEERKNIESLKKQVENLSRHLQVS